MDTNTDWIMRIDASQLYGGTNMQISIEYCVIWNYEPRALSLKATLEKNFPDVNVQLIKSDGGVFEVMQSDKLIFSKKQTGRFPEDSEIINALKQVWRKPDRLFFPFFWLLPQAPLLRGEGSVSPFQG